MKAVIVNGPLLYAPRNLFSTHIMPPPPPLPYFKVTLILSKILENRCDAFLTRLGNSNYFKNILEAKRI